MDMASIAASYDLIKNITESDLLEALSMLENDLNASTLTMPLSLLISRYAELNPENSIRFVEDHIQSTRSKMGAMLSIISTWAKKMPLEAYVW